MHFLFIFNTLSISTHILTKRMTALPFVFLTPSNISTHILTKRMTAISRIAPAIVLYFNSHPHEEDDLISNHPHRFLEYFNSHPHEEDDNDNTTQKDIPDISTHILTKRMTLAMIYALQKLKISTHILTKRMTSLQSRISEAQSFQLTSSRRG